MNMRRINVGNVSTEAQVKFFEGERWMVLTGLLGFLLAGICGVWALFNGVSVGAGGDVLKAFSFDAAIGMFLLTTAAIIPFAALGVRGKKIFRRSQIMLVLFCYFAETVQNFRGVNPRFVENGTPFDNIVSELFSLVAFLIVLNYLIFAVYFFRKKAYMQRAAIVLGIRYSMISVMIAFAAGIWMAVNQGRFVGLAGNIVWLHGLGFHALQALPFVAWLTERKSISRLMSHRLIHITGIAFVLGLVAVGWQTYLGISIFHLSVQSVLAVCCFLLSLVPIVIMFRQSAGTAGKRIYNNL